MNEIVQDHKNYPQATYYKILDSVNNKKYVLLKETADDFARQYTQEKKNLSYHLMLQDATLHTFVLDVDYKGNCNDVDCIKKQRIRAIETITNTLLQFGVATHRKLACVVIFLWNNISGGIHVYIPECVIASEDYEILLHQLKDIVFNGGKCTHTWIYDKRIQNFPLAKAGKQGKSNYKLTSIAFLHVNEKKIYNSDNMKQLYEDLKDVNKHFKMTAVGNVEKQVLDQFLVSKLKFIHDNNDIRLLQFPFPVNKQYRFLLWHIKFRMETCTEAEAKSSSWQLSIENVDGTVVTYVKRNCKLLEVKLYNKNGISELYHIIKRACSYLKTFICRVFETESTVVKRWISNNSISINLLENQSVLCISNTVLQREIYSLRKKNDPIGFLLALAPDVKIPLLYACCNLGFIEKCPNAHEAVCDEFLNAYGENDSAVLRLKSIDESIVRQVVKHFNKHSLLYIAQSVLYENCADIAWDLFPTGKKVGENTLLKEDAYKDYEDLFITHNIETIDDSEESLDGTSKKRKNNKFSQEYQTLIAVCESILTSLVSSLFPVVWTTSEGKHVQFIWLSRHWCDADSSSGEKTLRTLLRGLFYELATVFGGQYPLHGICDTVVSKAETHFEIQKLQKKNETTSMDETTHVICLKNGTQLFNLLTLSVHRNTPHFFTTSRCEILWNGIHSETLLSTSYLTKLSKFLFDENSINALRCDSKQDKSNSFRKYMHESINSIFPDVCCEIRQSLADACTMFMSCASLIGSRIKSICKLLAYSLIGINIDKKLVVFWGPDGDNGKTIFFTTIKQIFGGCVGVLQQDVLMKKKEANEREKDIAENIFRRFVYVDDNGNGALNPDLIKDLTGGGKRTVRRIYRSPVNKSIMFVLFMSMNEPPTCEGEPAQAFLKRICLMKWESQFNCCHESKSVQEMIETKKFPVEYFPVDGLILGFISILAATLLPSPKGFFNTKNARIMDIDGCNEESKKEFIENMDPLGKFIQWSNLIITNNDAITLTCIRVQTMIRKFITYKRWTGGVTLEHTLMEKFKCRFKDYLHVEDEESDCEDYVEENTTALKLLSLKKRKKNIRKIPVAFFKCLQFKQN